MPEMPLPPPSQLEEFCRRHYIRRLSLFGSVLRGDCGPKSGVDLLVEFEPGHTPGWEIVDIEEEFSRLFGGRTVDLINPKYLNRRLKDRILAEAQLQYERSHAEG
jgi:uncharacterized protein